MEVNRGDLSYFVPSREAARDNVRFDNGLRIIFYSCSKHVSCEFNTMFVLCEAVLMSGTPILNISVTTQVSISRKSSPISTGSEGPPSRAG